MIFKALFDVSARSKLFMRNDLCDFVAALNWVNEEIGSARQGRRLNNRIVLKVAQFFRRAVPKAHPDFLIRTLRIWIEYFVGNRFWLIDGTVVAHNVGNGQAQEP